MRKWIAKYFGNNSNPFFLQKKKTKNLNYVAVITTKKFAFSKLLLSPTPLGVPLHPEPTSIITSEAGDKFFEPL